MAKRKKRRSREKTDWGFWFPVIQIAIIIIVILSGFVVGGVLWYQGWFRLAGFAVAVAFWLVGVALAIQKAYEDDEILHVVLVIFIPLYWIYFFFSNIDRYLLPLIFYGAAALFATGGAVSEFAYEMHQERMDILRQQNNLPPQNNPPPPPNNQRPRPNNQPPRNVVPGQR